MRTASAVTIAVVPDVDCGDWRGFNRDGDAVSPIERGDDDHGFSNACVTCGWRRLHAEHGFEDADDSGRARRRAHRTPWSITTVDNSVASGDKTVTVTGTPTNSVGTGSVTAATLTISR